MVPYPDAMQRFPRLRQSTLSTFDSCGFASNLELRRVGWSQHHHARGTLFHRVAAECLRTMNRLGEPRIEVDVALSILSDLLRADDVDRECPACASDDIVPGVSGDGMRTCRECGSRFETEWESVPMKEVDDLWWIVKKWASSYSWATDEFVAIEERLYAQVEYPNRVAGGLVRREVTGQIDLLMLDPADPFHAYVWDWKTGWAVPGASEMSTLGYFQQRVYALLVLLNYPAIQRVTLREAYVRKGVEREASLHRDDLGVILEQIGALVERFDRSVQESLWVPSPGAHCAYCPAPQRCPIDRGDRGAGTIRTQAEAERAARLYLVAKANAEQAEKALKAWAKVHGPIPVKHAKAQGLGLGFAESVQTVKPDLDAVRGVPSDQVASLYRQRTVSRFGMVPLPSAREVEAAERAELDVLEAAVAEAEAARRDDPA